MRIAYVTETYLPSTDGVVTRMRHAVDWLVRAGHDVLVVCPDVGGFDHAGYDVAGVRAVRYPLYRSRAWGTPSPSVGRALAGFRPDVVHCWQPSLVGLPAVLWACGHNVPLVTSYHTDISSYLSYYGPARLIRRPAERYMRWLCNRSPLTLVTSRAMGDKLDGLGFTGLRVLPRGVDLSARDPRFRSAAMRERLSGGRPEAPLLVFVGRVAAEKGLATLEPLMRTHPSWRLAVVGDGPAREGLERQFAGTGATFTGFMSGRELSEAFASGDAFVFPSLTETLGLVLLEAMASGVPVVAAHSPATDEQLRDGENGLTYDAADPAALEAAVTRALSDEPLRERVRDAALADARHESWDNASAALMGAYEETLAAYADGWRPPRHPGGRWAGQGGPMPALPVVPRDAEAGGIVGATPTPDPRGAR